MVVKKRSETEDGQDDQTRLFGFRPAYVFDLTQTEGNPLPEFASVKGDPKDYADRLKSFIVSAGISLECDASIAPAQGLSCGGRIRILPGLPPAEEFSVLVHELSHELLHRSEGRTATTKTIRETEAEAVAFVVCTTIGLDTNTAAADYIQIYNGDKQTLADSLGFIQSAAAAILDALVPEGAQRSNQIKGAGQHV
jgi:hypothetical protein